MTLNSYVRVLFSLQLVLNLCRVHFDYLQAGWREAEGRVVICHDPSHFWRNFQPGRWCKNWWVWQSRWDACDMTPRVRQAGSLNPPKYCILVTGRGGGRTKICTVHEDDNMSNTTTVFPRATWIMFADFSVDLKALNPLVEWRRNALRYPLFPANLSWGLYQPIFF